MNYQITLTGRQRAVILFALNKHIKKVRKLIKECRSLEAAALYQKELEDAGAAYDAVLLVEVAK